jgi:OOP family OmpA-OmpF porin
MRFYFTLFLVVILTPLSAQLNYNSFQLVNTSYDEQSPVVSPDGRTLFFTVANHPQNMGGKKDPGDIWFSRLIGDQWSAPIHGGEILNDKAYNAVAGVSGNGDKLFLHGHYNPQGGLAKTQGISFSTNGGSGWTKPVNISIPYFQNKSGTLCGAISADNSVFVFSAETYGTHGVDDIYVSTNSGGKWSEPRNLGKLINTQFQELSPWLGSDDKTLYFSTNGRSGSGSFDVYSSTRLDDTWTNWSTPVNMGANINTEGRELFFRIYPEFGFNIYTSTRNSDGYGDIKIFRNDTPYVKKDSATTIVNHAPDTLVKITPVIHDTATHEAKVVRIYGRVSNAKTGEAITSRISFSGPKASVQEATSGAEGYSIAIPSTQEYDVKIEANGYVSTLEQLDINTYEMRDLEMNFKLQPVEVGTTVNLKHVLFAQAKTEILPESFPELDLVVSFLKENPNVKIELSGHTDSRGVHADNVKLSQQRVNKVKEYLVAKGIDGKRISGKGYGGLKPIASNDSEDSRKMNRRVEFTIKKF